eukprot:m51a1_g14180 hypothetical protein (919) ;mRNA; r:51878-56567
MSSKHKFVCALCSGTDFDVQDGTAFCRDCGAQSQQYIDTLLEANEVFAEGQAWDKVMRFRTHKAPKRKSKVAEMGGTYGSIGFMNALEALVFYHADAMIENLGAPKKLKEIAEKLWAAWRYRQDEEAIDRTPWLYDAAVRKRMLQARCPADGQTRRRPAARQQRDPMTGLSEQRTHADERGVSFSGQQKRCRDVRLGLKTLGREYPDDERQREREGEGEQSQRVLERLRAERDDSEPEAEGDAVPGAEQDEEDPEDGGDERQDAEQAEQERVFVQLVLWGSKTGDRKFRKRQLRKARVIPLAFCYLASLWTRLPYTASDFLRWALDGTLPFFTSVRVLPVGDQMRSFFYPKRVFQPSYLSTLACALAAELEFVPPQLNADYVMLRMAESLHLPESVLRLAYDLKELIPAKANMSTPVVAALLAVAMKLKFPGDYDTDTPTAEQRDSFLFKWVDYWGQASEPHPYQSARDVLDSPRETVFEYTEFCKDTVFHEETPWLATKGIARLFKTLKDEAKQDEVLEKPSAPVELHPDPAVEDGDPSLVYYDDKWSKPLLPGIRAFHLNLHGTPFVFDTFDALDKQHNSGRLPLVYEAMLAVFARWICIPTQSMHEVVLQVERVVVGATGDPQRPPLKGSCPVSAESQGALMGRLKKTPVLPKPRRKHKHLGNGQLASVESAMTGANLTDRLSLALPDLFSYSFQTSTWEEILPVKGWEGPPPVHSHAAVAWQGSLWVFGGISRDSTVLDTLYTFHCVHNGRMVVFGGIASVCLNDLHLMPLPMPDGSRRAAAVPRSPLASLVDNPMSDHFKAVITSGLSESQCNEIVLGDDVTRDALVSLLAWIYTDKVPLPLGPDGLVELLVLADRFVLEALREECGELLVQAALTQDTAAELRRIAEDTNCHTLATACDAVLSEHSSPQSPN